MKRPIRPLLKRHGLFIALTLLSAIHLGTVAKGVMANPQQITVSDLPAYTLLESELLAHPALEAEQGCQVVVVFDPLCPFCNRAAEAQLERDEPLPFPTTWIARNDEAAEYFQGEHPDLQVAQHLALIEALDVKGVPAAFLLSEGMVLDSWGYSGSEDIDVVAARCYAAPPSSQGVLALAEDQE